MGYFRFPAKAGIHTIATNWFPLFMSVGSKIPLHLVHDRGLNFILYSLINYHKNNITSRKFF